MIKKFLIILSAIMLTTAISVGAEQVNITVNETSTGLSVSVTAPENGGMYIIGAEYSKDGVLEHVKMQHIDNVVSGEVYIAKLDGIYSGSNIYIWNDNQEPLCERIEYNAPAPVPTAIPGPTDEPEGDGIIHLNGDSINADGVDNTTVDGTTVTIIAAGEYTIEGTLSDGQIIVAAPSKNDEPMTVLCRWGMLILSAEL